MPPRHPSLATLRRTLAALLLAPFLLTSLVAAGTMPARGPDGVEIVICTGDGMATITITVTVPATDAPHAPANPHDRCAWDDASHPALAATQAVLPDAPPTTLRPAQLAPSVLPAIAPAPLRRTANRDPPAPV